MRYESGVILEPLTALNAIPNSLPRARLWTSTHHVLTLRKWMERWQLSTHFHKRQLEKVRLTVRCTSVVVLWCIGTMCTFKVRYCVVITGFVLKEQAGLRMDYNRMIAGFRVAALVSLPTRGPNMRTGLKHLRNLSLLFKIHFPFSSLKWLNRVKFSANIQSTLIVFPFFEV